MAAKKFLFRWRAAMQAAPELSSTDRHVGLVVSLHADTNTGSDSFPSITTIAALTARKRATVIKSIVRLEEQGWLHVERRNLPGKQARAKSYYTLKIPSKLVPVEAPGLVPVEAPASAAAEVVPVEAEVVPVEAEVVPIEDGGGARRDTNLVPEGAPELFLTSPSNSQENSESLVVGTDVGVWPPTAEAIVTATLRHFDERRLPISTINAQTFTEGEIEGIGMLQLLHERTRFKVKCLADVVQSAA